jgi:hypothetical protein
MNKKILKLIISSLIIFHSCNLKREALGADNEIRVICSDIDRKLVEKYLNQIFIDTLFCPEPEPLYYFKFTSPETYENFKEQSKIIVAAINREVGNSGVKLLKKILPEKQYLQTLKNDPVILSRDVFSKNQLFMVINAESEESLFKNIKNKSNSYRKIFNEHFKIRQRQYLTYENRNRKLEDSLRTNFGWSMKIPWGWIKIKSSRDSNFVWIGNEMPFQWVGISKTDGDVISKMNSLEIGKYMWDWPENFYKNVRFNNYKFELDEMPFSGAVAWRAKGVWESINKLDAKGGPFCSYLFYDKMNNKTYYINYLIHHPGNNKSIFMRKLDLMIKTFSAKK